MDFDLKPLLAPYFEIIETLNSPDYLSFPDEFLDIMDSPQWPPLMIPITVPAVASPQTTDSGVGITSTESSVYTPATQFSPFQGPQI